MSAPVLTFFNNKGGVGKTSLIYHLAWTLADQGKSVLIADLDPQANLTAAFLNDVQLDELWESHEPGATIYRSVKPLTDVGDLAPPELRKITANLHLIPSEVAFSRFEEVLSSAWPAAMGNSNLYRPLRILSSIGELLRTAAAMIDADIILVDIGPNLGAINRSVLIASDFVAIPLASDASALQSLESIGPTMRNWKDGWRKRLENWHGNPESKEHRELVLPDGGMHPIGYLRQQYGVRLDRPVKAYDKWVKRIPEVYREAVLNENPPSQVPAAGDPHCLATIKHYRSLIPMAQEHRKPIFKLTAADGAIGGHAGAVQDARKDFEDLARKITDKIETFGCI